MLDRGRRFLLVIALLFAKFRVSSSVWGVDTWMTTGPEFLPCGSAGCNIQVFQACVIDIKIKNFELDPWTVNGSRICLVKTWACLKNSVIARSNPTVFIQAMRPLSSEQRQETNENEIPYVVPPTVAGTRYRSLQKCKYIRVYIYTSILYVPVLYRVYLVDTVYYSTLYCTTPYYTIYVQHTATYIDVAR